MAKILTPYMTDWRFASSLPNSPNSSLYSSILKEALLNVHSFETLFELPEDLIICGIVNDDRFFEPGRIIIRNIKSISLAYTDKAHLIYKVATNDLDYYVDPFDYREQRFQIIVAPFISNADASYV